MVIFVVVDGLIGVGKSTVVREFKKRGYVVEEQKVEKWTLLKDYYYEPEKYAYELQKQVIDSYNEIQQKYEKNYGKDVIILESCAVASFNTFARMLHDKSLLSKDQMLNLKEMIRKLNESLVIYVDSDMHTIFKRIKERNRPGEDKIEENYMYKLRDSYEKYLISEEIPLLMRVDNNPEHGYISLVDNIIKQFFVVNTCDIAIEGLIGAGKTTFGRYLHDKDCGFNFIEQELNDTILDLLDKRYNGKNVVYELQYEFIKSYRSTIDKRSDPKKTNVYEGILSLIPVFTKYAETTDEISEKQYQILKESYIMNGLPKSSDFKLIVYLSPDLETICKQIKQRGRKGEANITIQYLKNIQFFYKKLMDELGDVLVLDNTKYNTKEDLMNHIYNHFRNNYFKTKNKK